jgi:hypothetical protein
MVDGRHDQTFHVLGCGSHSSVHAERHVCGRFRAKRVDRFDVLPPTSQGQNPALTVKSKDVKPKVKAGIWP